MPDDEQFSKHPFRSLFCVANIDKSWVTFDFDEFVSSKLNLIVSNVVLAKELVFVIELKLLAVAADNGEKLLSFI
jgi:hypothetical protein